MAVCSIVTNTEPTVHEPHLPPPPSELPAWGPGLDVGLRSSEEETEGTVGPAQVLPRPGRGPCCVRAPGHCPRVTALSPLSVSGHSVDPGLAGLLGQRAPRSKQPFMVTFFRASSSPIRAPRAVRPLKRRLPKKTNELPQPNRLPGIFGEVRVGPGSEPAGFRPRTSGGDRALQLSVGFKLVVTLQPPFLIASFVPCTLGTGHCTVSLASLLPCPFSALPWLTRPSQKSPSESGAPSSRQPGPWRPSVHPGHPAAKASPPGQI